MIVPVVLTLGGYLFTRSENRRTQSIADRRAETDREIAKQRAKIDQEIAGHSRQDDILQAYLDQMGHLLLDTHRPLRQSGEGDEVRTLARARTLTVLSQLDGGRKGALLQVILEAGLITGTLQVSRQERTYPVISLEDADLRNLYIFGYDLSSTIMTAAQMTGAELDTCGLTGSWLNGAWLDNASLIATDLSDADLNGASLRGANLAGANMEGANLDGANITQEQLAQVESLKNAPMPDGRKYEDWLDDRGRRDGESDIQ